MSIPEFIFCDDLLSGDADCWGVFVPPEIGDREELFATYVQRLSLPGYFGDNFDALDECLRDLSWIDPGTRVVIQHFDLPLSEDEEHCRTYLQLLQDAVRFWQERGQDRLAVVFPQLVEEEANRLLA